MEKGFVLIPGAGMSDWIWTRLLPLLTKKAVQYLCTEDRTLTRAQQEAFAANLAISDIRCLESDHMCMISHAAEIACILNEIAGQE